MHIPISHFGSYKAKCTKRIQEKCIYVNANAFLHASESILNSSRIMSSVFAFAFKTRWI